MDKGTCLSCLGSGVISSERGPSRCPDCDGTGKIGSVFRRNEQRLRKIEEAVLRATGEAALDSKWLVDELRRSRDALLKVLTAAQDGDASDALLAQIRFEANEVLGVYEKEDS